MGQMNPFKMLGTFLSGAGAYGEGAAAKISADYEADQLDSNAKLVEAQSQKEAIEERRKARIAESRVTALAASGGGSATDVGVVDIKDDINEQGELNALTALFDGDQRALGLRRKAVARRYEGKVAKRLGTVRAASTFLTADYK